MNLDKWVHPYKIRAFPWIDGKHIYFNMQYFAPGQSIAQPPVWEKTVYITDNEAGRRMVYEFTDSFVEYVANMQIPKNADKIVLTAQ